MRRVMMIAGVIVALAASVLLYASGRNEQVPYPDGYRQWVHVKSMVIQKGHPLYDAFGGIHHIYANDRALKAMQSGKPFPDGAVLVFDLLEARQEDHAIVEGPRKVVGVMHKNSKKFAATGGWGYEGFQGDTRKRVVKDPAQDCHMCHSSQKEHDYVFSRFRK